ncbi:MAG: hypothetical protein ACYC7D_12630 [Nitrososphaerales archaeon]
MSRAEEITSEVRKLVMTCRAMEAQLQQSISKKAHQEVVTKMQATIDGLNAEIERTKSELQNTVSIGDRVNTLSSQVTSQNETIANLSMIVTNQRETVESLSSTLSRNTESLESKLSRETVPVLLYNETLARIGEMEEKLRFMVERADYVAAQKRSDELSEKITTMVPMTEYLALQSQFSNYVPKEQFEEAQRAIANSVPSERFAEKETQIADLQAKLAQSVPGEVYSGVESRAKDYETRLAASVPVDEFQKLEAHATELEARLAASVPRADYDELTARIASLAKEASISFEVAAPSPAQEAPAPTPIHERTASIVPEQTAQAPIVAAAETAEIREVQTQLSEIKNTTETGATTFSPVIVETTRAFNFLNTSLSAKSGLEFLTDIEQVPVDILESHAKSGDFERWFMDVLQDEYSSASLKTVRESNLAGEELRAKIVEVIAPRYKS